MPRTSAVGATQSSPARSAAECWVGAMNDGVSRLSAGGTHGARARARAWRPEAPIERMSGLTACESYEYV